MCLDLAVRTLAVITELFQTLVVVRLFVCVFLGGFCCCCCCLDLLLLLMWRGGGGANTEGLTETPAETQPLRSGRELWLMGLTTRGSEGYAAGSDGGRGWRSCPSMDLIYNREREGSMYQATQSSLSFSVAILRSESLACYRQTISPSARRIFSDFCFGQRLTSTLSEATSACYYYWGTRAGVWISWGWGDWVPMARTE